LPKRDAVLNRAHRLLRPRLHRPSSPRSRPTQRSRHRRQPQPASRTHLPMPLRLLPLMLQLMLPQKLPLMLPLLLPLMLPLMLPQKLPLMLPLILPLILPLMLPPSHLRLPQPHRTPLSARQKLPRPTLVRHQRSFRLYTTPLTPTSSLGCPRTPPQKPPRWRPPAQRGCTPAAQRSSSSVISPASRSRINVVTAVQILPTRRLMLHSPATRWSRVP
jgi:hypothetical protein